MKLQPHHIFPYAAYGLKFKMTANFEDEFSNQDWAEDPSIFTEGSIWTLAGYADRDLMIPLGEGEIDGYIFRNRNTYVNIDTNNGGIKPMLRPLDLTKPITVDGIEIVPIVELAKIAYPNESDYRLITNIGKPDDTSEAIINKYDGFYFGYNHKTKCFYWRTVNGLGNGSAQNANALFQWLYKHHFDLENLIEQGLAVELT